MIQVHQIGNKENIYLEQIEKFDHDIFINEPHTHNFCEVGYFENSDGMHTIDFEPYPIKDNTVYFLKKGIVHTLLRKKGSSGKVISFRDDMINDQVLLQRLFIAQPHLYLDDSQFQNLKILFSQLENYLTNETCSRQLIQSYLLVILSFYDNYGGSSTQYNGLLHEYLMYVEKHFSAKLTVQQCVSDLSISYQQLFLEVNKKLNTTPIDIIKDRVILQAKRYLFNTNLSSKEIAYELDFEDASYFSKYFKSNTGESPIEFRNKSRMK